MAAKIDEANLRLTEARRNIDEAITELQDNLDDFERAFKKIHPEYEHIIAVLEKLRQRPYEFYVCVSTSDVTTYLNVTTFTLEEDAKEWVMWERKAGATATWRKQTLPLPDVEKMRELLKEASEAIEIGYGAGHPIVMAIKEALRD